MNISAPWIELTPEEQEILDTRSLVIKEIIKNKWKYVFEKIYPCIMWSFFLSCITFIISTVFLEEIIWSKDVFEEIISMKLVTVPAVLLLLSPFIWFFKWFFELWKYRYIYITHEQIIFGEKMYNLWSAELRNLLEKQKITNFSFFWKLLILVPILVCASIIIYVIIKLNIFATISMQLKYFFVGYVGLVIFLWVPFYYFFLKRTQTYFFNHFLSLGLKLQKIAPKIQLISKKFQYNFQEKVKSGTGFDSMRKFLDELSGNFSEVTEIIIELEKVEKKMDKWNLFDAIRYINSLKQDILAPIVNTRDLLMEQWNNLLFKETEKQKLRDEKSSLMVYTELQSVRSSVIKNELDANIEKLNVMIAKFGWVSEIKEESGTNGDILNVMITRLD